MESRVTKAKFEKSKKRFINSFKYAFIGIATTYKKEQNIKVHTLIAFLVIVFGFILKISYVEWLTCLTMIGLVITAEIVNTAIETTVDLASPEIHPLAKQAKDIASGAVLVSAITSAIIGLIIFVPKLISMIGVLK